MVILLVVERKVLGSLWNGSDVISVRKDIWTAANHICTNFPGADASQCGDLFVSMVGVWVGEVLYGAVGTADEKSWEHRRPRTLFSSWELLHLAHVTHLHKVKKNAGLEKCNLGEWKRNFRKRFQ